MNSITNSCSRPCILFNLAGYGAYPPQGSYPPQPYPNQPSGYPQQGYPPQGAGYPSQPYPQG